ncbi:MAG: hypothetical protein NC548_64700 [Lachnospiraceae bacterium]|nr:hypothetical protein [Lachnospiraceae bacterium]
MKTKFIIIATMMTIVGVHGNAIAYCNDWGDYSYLKNAYTNCTDQTASLVGHNCATMNPDESFMWHETDGKCYYVQSCKTCPSGYSLQYLDEDNSDFTYDYFCWYEPDESLLKASWPYHTCVKDTSCPDNTDWAALRTGYQKRTIYTGSNCTATIQYRCAAGYYGTSSNGTSGCTRCPAWSGAYKTSALNTRPLGTSAAGATAITGCYVSAGTYYDATGTFKISSTCPYKS